MVSIPRLFDNDAPSLFAARAFSDWLLAPGATKIPARNAVPEQRVTLCNRDCPDACAIVATIDGGRVTRIAGDREHPITQGFLCHRTSQFLRRQYAPDRLVTPLRRRGGVLTPCSWDEALDVVAEGLSRIIVESGPAAIFHYKSGGSLGMLTAQATELFFERLGPVTVKRGDICSGAGEAAQELDFGISESSDLFDLLNARHILLWGKNVHTSSPHTLPLLKRAQAAGSEIVLIDPVHHQGTQLCDRYVQLKPAGDFALAMAVARVLFERGWIDPLAEGYCEGLGAFRTLAEGRSTETWCRLADVDVEVAVDLARRLHRGPTTILVGWGMARRRIGGAIVRALDALGAVSGNLGIPGGGVSYYFRRRGAFRKLARGPEAAPRTVCEPLFGSEVLAKDDPPIRALWITAGNPVAMLPDSTRVAQALASRELTVVCDSWLSDSAALAHVVLPVTTLLEADELLGAYGHHYIGAASGVVPPPEGVKSDLQIMQALAQRMGLEDVMAGDAAAWKGRLLGPELRAQGIDVTHLEGGRLKNPLAARVLFEGRSFPTASGRATLIAAEPEAAQGDDDYPLVLMSLSTPRSQSSQWVREPPRPAEVTVHPEAAAGIADGAPAALESRLGRMRVRVRHDPAQRRDVALIPKGGHYRDAAAANLLIRAALTDIGEGGALYDERVRLVPEG
jgi:anaerobic selenocysteine-containing dehydrogenase